MNFFTINLYSGLNTLQEGDNPSDDAVALRGLREIEGDGNILERRGKQHALNEFKGHVRRENDAVWQKAGAFHAHGKSGAPRDDVHEPRAELWQKSVHGVEPAEGKVGIAGEFGAARMAEIVPQELQPVTMTLSGVPQRFAEGAEMVPCPSSESSAPMALKACMQS